VGESKWQPLSQLTQSEGASDAQKAPKDKASPPDGASSPSPSNSAAKPSSNSLAGAIGAALVGFGVMLVAALKKAPVGFVAARTATTIAHKQGYSWTSILAAVAKIAVSIIVALAAVAVTLMLISALARGLKYLLALLRAPVIPPGLAGPTMPPPSGQKAASPLPPTTDHSTAAWWVSHNGQSTGPFPTSAILDGAKSGRFRPETSICRTGDANWCSMSAWLQKHGSGP
jgi:hypothetical protein